MYVLMVTGIFPPDIGGPASYVPAVSGGLAARGHRVAVLTLSESTKQDNDAGFAFRVIRLPRRLFLPLRMAVSVAAILWHGRGADALYVHGLALESVVANVFLGKPMIQKIVGDRAWERARENGEVQDDIETFQKKRYSLKTECIKKLRCFWTGRSRAIIAPSRYLKKIIQAWGIPQERIAVIYNAVKPPPAGRVALSCMQRRTPAEHIAVSVGRMVPWKGFEGLIDAAASLPQVRLVLIGDGPERGRLERRVRERQVQERVCFAGTLSRAEVFACLCEADVFVLNSTYEGLPHIVLEAMAAGAPVVAADAGGTGELVAHGSSGVLVPPGNTNQLAEAIRSVMCDREYARRLSAGAREQLRRFTWETLVEQTENLILQTVRKPA